MWQWVVGFDIFPARRSIFERSQQSDRNVPYGTAPPKALHEKLHQQFRRYMPHEQPLVSATVRAPAGVAQHFAVFFRHEHRFRLEIEVVGSERSRHEIAVVNHCLSRSPEEARVRGDSADCIAVARFIWPDCRHSTLLPAANDEPPRCLFCRHLAHDSMDLHKNCIRVAQ